MADRIAVRWGFVVSACLVLAGCGREREIVPLPEAPGPASKVALSPLELKDVEAFDRLDRRILASGGPAELVKVYDDLARVAGNDPRVLVRGALAALAADPKEQGPLVVEGVLTRLATEAPGNADAAWLALRMARLRLAPGGTPLKATSDSGADALRTLATNATAFAAANPAWKGPFGAGAADATRTAADADAAVVAWEAAKAAAPATDAATTPAAEGGARGPAN